MTERDVASKPDAKPSGAFTWPTTTATGDPYVEGAEINCARCGVKTIPLHRFCKLCEDCCDCRPFGT